MKIRKSDLGKHYNWLMGADMYLAASVVLCKRMLKSYRSPISSLNNGQQIDKECGFTSSNPDYEMLMPVIFNLKHGIELYLKALIMQIDHKLEYPISHDLIVLLNTLIRQIQKKDQKYIKLELLDKDLRSCIEKYYYGIYAFASIRAEADICNEAERYPEYQNTNCYKIKELYKLDMHTLLNDIKTDCIYLQKTFREEILKKI